jgi:hypothetical protein
MPAAAGALSLDALLAPDTQKKLFASKMLTEAHFDAPESTLAPKAGALSAEIARMKAAIEPSVLIESLCFYQKPPRAGAWTAAEKTRLVNGITALSTLAGIRYYSNSRKQTRVFYETSRVIDGPERRTPLPDPRFSSENLPSRLSLFAQQKDLTFGDNVYRYDFTIEDNIILISQTNLTTLYYGIMPVLGKEELRSIIALINCDDYILVYMASMADAVSLPGLKNRVGRSFASRADAVLGWFVAKADAVYNKDEDEN